MIAAAVLGRAGVVVGVHAWRHRRAAVAWYAHSLVTSVSVKEVVDVAIEGVWARMERHGMTVGDDIARDTELCFRVPRAGQLRPDAADSGSVGHWSPLFRTTGFSKRHAATRTDGTRPASTKLQ